MPTKSPNRAFMHGHDKRVEFRDRTWLKALNMVEILRAAQDDVKSFAAEKDSKQLDTPIHDRPDDEDN
jgi:hypothetical protein